MSEISERDREMARNIACALREHADDERLDAYAITICRARAEERGNLKNRLSLRLNNYLIEMEPGYDDSIAGFNEAWDVVRSVFGDTDLDGLLQDAARYRWVRENITCFYVGEENVDRNAATPGDFDVLIDAEIAREKGRADG